MHHLAETYGVWLVAALITIESIGVPVPGETTLIASSIYAGTAHLSIWLIIAAAVGGAIVGNVIGYTIGRFFGFRLLVRYGSYVRLPEARLKIGEYLFRHYGIAAIVVARFVPLLRSLAPLVAGANRMPFPQFLVATVAGAIGWVMLDSLAAYYFGKELIHLSTGGAIDIGVAALLVVGGIAWFISQHEQQLQEKAEREFPGPLPRR